MSDIRIPDLTGKELKPGYGIQYQPTKYKDFKEQSEDARELKSQETNWHVPYIVVAIILLFVAWKLLRVHPAKPEPQSATKPPGSD